MPAVFKPIRLSRPEQDCKYKSNLKFTQLFREDDI
jgi:hypothetical protein